MLAFLIFPWWYQAPMKIALPLAAQSLVQKWSRETGLEFEVEWLKDGESPSRFFVTTASLNKDLVYG
jgi:hypothetical protein